MGVFALTITDLGVVWELHNCGWMQSNSQFFDFTRYSALRFALGNREWGMGNG